MSDFYPAMAGSPVTTLAASISAAVTTIELVNGAKVPAAPNKFSIGQGEDVETVKYTSKVGNICSGITRGYDGTMAKAWNQGTKVARVFTKGDFEELQNETKALIVAVAAISPALVDDPNPTLGANLNAAGFAILNALLGTDLAAAGFKITNVGIENYYEQCVVANSGVAYTFNLANGNAYLITMTGNCVFTMPALPAAGSGKAQSLTVRLVQDGTGSRTITFPAANVMWPGGVMPTFSAVANRIDKVVFTGWPGATKWEGDLTGVHYS